MALTKKKPSDARSATEKKSPAQTSRDCVLTNEIALHWARLPSWSLREAIYLARNKDPVCEAAIAQIRGHKTIRVGKISTTVKKSLSDTVLRANKGGDLPEHVTPARFVEWARTVGVELPDMLVAAVITTHSQAKDWKAEFDRSQCELTRQIEQNALLKLENDSLKRTLKNDELGTKEKASVYKIIAGLAYKYGHRPTINSKATSIMCDAVNKIGLKIDEDTVRNKIKESFNMYIDTIKKL